MPFLVILFLISGITSAYSGTFYTTGKEFYEGCWQRKTKDEAWKNAVAATPSEAAVWARCSPMVAETMDSIGFAISSSNENAPADMKALVGFCPNQWSELPMALDRLYVPIIETIEGMGGPSVTENLAPASWIIQRALGLESSNADADPPVIWGRPHAWGSNRHAHPRDPPG
jgi:hypothetical protein